MVLSGEEQEEDDEQALSSARLAEAPKLELQASRIEIREEPATRIALPSAAHLKVNEAAVNTTIMAPSAVPTFTGHGSLHVEKHGALNGFGTRSTSSQYGAQKRSMRSSGRFQTSTVEDTSVTLQRRMARELGSSFSEKVSSADYTALVEWIHYERLMSLPKEGSAWDKASRSSVLQQLLLMYIRFSFLHKLWQSASTRLRHRWTDSPVETHSVLNWLMAILSFYWSSGVRIVKLLTRT